MDKSDNVGRKRWPLLVKILAIGVVIVTPVVVMFLFLKPLVFKQNVQRYSQTYQLPKNFSEEDLGNLAQKMRSDPEFIFYFENLSEKQLINAIYEVYLIADANRDASKQLHSVDELQTRVEALGVLFNSLNYPDDFLNNPQEYPQLGEPMWTFLYEDFKATLLGLVFKANKSDRFSFDWKPSTRLAARKLYDIIIKLNPKQRQQLSDLFVIHK